MSLFRIRIQKECKDSDEFFAQVWNALEGGGLVGVHEGTVLTEEAHEMGFESKGVVLDSAQPPLSRDWIQDRGGVLAELYFSGEAEANAAIDKIRLLADQVSEVESVEEENWNQSWEEFYRSQASGIEIPPFWTVVPVSDAESESPAVQKSRKVIRIIPGTGFGTGTHETTQLCLEAIGQWSQKRQGPFDALDFGSGSGILSVALALLGAQVDSVEIDPLAIENAKANWMQNRLSESLVCFSEEFKPRKQYYDVVVANILKPVLLEHANTLVRSLKKEGTVILSGLLAEDCDEVQNTYLDLLGGYQAEISSLNEWSRIVFFKK